WTLSSIAVGLILVLAFEVGARRQPSLVLLVGGAIVGFCIYASSILFDTFVGCHIDKIRSPVRAPLRVIMTVVAGFVGWVVGFLISALIVTGRPMFRDLLGPETRSLLWIVLAITLLLSTFAHGYEELRRRLTTSVEQ